MLQPDARRYLLEILRPDHGYALDFAVGTSYSLDLATLMTVPLAFTLFGWSADEKPQGADPVVLFNSLQRYASRIALFCQAGGIYLPGRYQPLLAYLERSIYQVTPQTANRVFHPKVWMLRYLPAGMPNGEPRYRLVCLSRNLTFDRSWDTSLVLDGAPDGRTHAENKPLCDFLAALPQLVSGGQVDDERKTLIAHMIDELPGIRFEAPPGFRDVAFVPMGIGIPESTPLQMNFERICVVSPFLQPSTLEQLTRAGARHVLVSRLEALQELKPKDLAGFAHLYALSDAAVIEPDDKPEATPDENLALRDEDRDQLSGLHAKLFIGEVDQTAYVWTGSANATTAAFDGNVEFMVRMQGDRASQGIDAFLGNASGQDGMASLLDPFTPADPMPVDRVQKTLEKLLDLARRAVVDAKFQGAVTRDQNRNQETYTVALAATASTSWPSTVDVRCWPITLPAIGARPLVKPSANLSTVQFSELSFEGLTTFFAFRITARQDDRTAEHTLVLNIPLSGLPDGRDDRLLQSILQDRSQLLRLLWLLLADTEHEIDLRGGMGGAFQNGQWRPFGADGPLFEAMVRALDRNPERLDTVERLVASLQKSPESRNLLPEQFDEIWQPIWAVRQTLKVESDHGTS